MSKVPKYAARRDTNERQIVEALRMVPGVTVIHLSAPGLPDLAVGFRKCTYFLEIKGKSGKLTEPEQDFFDVWTGHAAVVRSIDEALKAIGAIE